MSTVMLKQCYFKWNIFAIHSTEHELVLVMKVQLFFLLVQLRLTIKE
jgi:hypothetical protein